MWRLSRPVIQPQQPMLICTCGSLVADACCPINPTERQLVCQRLLTTEWKPIYPQTILASYGHVFLQGNSKLHLIYPPESQREAQARSIVHFKFVEEEPVESMGKCGLPAPRSEPDINHQAWFQPRYCDL